jgi:hypothetical protein
MLRARDLAAPERLFVDRIRRGETQAEAAERLGVSLYKFSGWESGTREGVPAVRTGRLSEREVFALMRRRCELSIGEAAELVGCSANWIGDMEKPSGASLHRYREFWGLFEGFTTPQIVARVKRQATDARKRRSLGS